MRPAARMHAWPGRHCARRRRTRCRGWRRGWRARVHHHRWRGAAALPAPAGAHRRDRRRRPARRHRDQQRQRRRELAHALDLGGRWRPPPGRAGRCGSRAPREPRDVFEGRSPVTRRCAAGRRRPGWSAAQQEQALPSYSSQGSTESEAHEGRASPRRPVALGRPRAYCSAVLPMSPRLASRITGTSAALRMRHQAFELVFGALRGEVGDLRLEGQHQILVASTMVAQKSKMREGSCCQAPGNLAAAWGPADAQQRDARAAAASMSVNIIGCPQTGSVAPAPPPRRCSRSASAPAAVVSPRAAGSASADELAHRLGATDALRASAPSTARRGWAGRGGASPSDRFGQHLPRGVQVGGQRGGVDLQLVQPALQASQPSSVQPSATPMPGSTVLSVRSRCQPADRRLALRCVSSALPRPSRCLGVFEVDRADLVRHGRCCRSRLPSALFEVAQRHVGL